MLPELWNIIFEMSDNKELMILKQVSKHFIIEPILKKRRLNYPRIGHCKIHKVPFADDYINSKPNLILKYLYNTGFDLVKGDIIKSDNMGYQGIYDGNYLIIYFYSLCELNRLPDMFDMIKDKVPFDYWNDSNMPFFEVFSINITPYLNQCIKNIKFDILSNITTCHDAYKDDMVLYTTFKADKEYIILGGVGMQNMYDESRRFKNKLHDQNIFYIDSDYGLNTLLMDYY